MFCVFSVTVVDSATRALQYLGLDVEKKSVEYEVKNQKRRIWFPEKIRV